MSNEVFPSIRYARDVTKKPEFTTLIQRAASKRELRASLTAYPLYTIDLSFPVLTQADVETLCGFFMARRGAFDSFLFSDPADNSVAAKQFAVGDGVTTQFQLTRNFGNFAEPCENIKSISTIKINGVPTIDYTLGGTGIVTLASPPADGAELTWSGSFYMRCRFAEDSAEFNQFFYRLYELGKIQLIGAPGNKV